MVEVPLIEEKISQFKALRRSNLTSVAQECENEIVNQIQAGLTTQEEENLLSDLKNNKIFSVKIAIALWKNLIEQGAIRKSKELYSKLFHELLIIKNQQGLSELVSSAERFYKENEITEQAFKLALIRGDTEKISNSIDNLGLDHESIKIINNNLIFWAERLPRIEQHIANILEDKKDKWIYKSYLKFTFDSILINGASEEIRKRFSNIKVDREKISTLETSIEMDDEISDIKKIENQIQIFLKIGKKSKALELLSKISDENLKKKLKKQISVDEKQVQLSNFNIDDYQTVTDEKINSLVLRIEKAITGNTEFERKMSFLNFCIASNLNQKAEETIVELLRMTTEDSTRVDLKFLLIQIYFQDNKKTQALIEINDLIKNDPLSKEELKLADWYLKRIFHGEVR